MEEIYYAQMARNPNTMTSTTSTTSNLYHLPHSQDDFFDFEKKNSTFSATSPSLSRRSPTLTQNVPSVPNDNESLQQLKQGLGKVLSTMERLEQRITRLEQTANTILKNQQEVLQVPFMSQVDIDRARLAAEQLEQDSSVAKQLQAAYNKEVEVRKSTSTYSARLSDCPICGVRVNQMELESHVDQCLELFSDDPKKEIQVQETKKKMETGFFGRLFKTTTKTETTKVVSTSPPPTSTQRPDSNSQSLYPGYGYNPYPNMNQQSGNGQNVPVMMPMYMYPSYPHQMTQLE